MYNPLLTIFVSSLQSWNYENTMFLILLPTKGGGFIQSLSQTFEERGPITFDQVFLSFEILEEAVLGPLEGSPNGEDSNSHTA